MSEFKGTPGPWSVMDGHYPSMKEIVGPSFNIDIVMSATDIDINEHMRRSADAHLIAAAPDLMEALESAISAFEEIQGESATDRLICIDEVEKARAAIRKALGKEFAQ